MDMLLIDKAIAAYSDIEDDTTKNRLLFYRGLWDIQKRYSTQFEQEQYFVIPSLEERKKALFAHEPLNSLVKFDIPAEWVADVCKDIACYLADSGSFKPAMCDWIRAFSWEKVLAVKDFASSLVHPDTYLAALSEALSAEGDYSQEQLSLVQWVLMSTLRACAEPVAQALMSGLLLDTANPETHSLTCPVCGSLSSFAVVGPTAQTEVNGRKLYCGYCATLWEFERVRCARCGSQDQTKLSYFNLENDDAHRLHSCNACGSYIRTVWQPSLQAPLQYDVEDVVMARLDAAASTLNA